MRRFVLGLALAFLLAPAVVCAAPKPAPAYERYGPIERFQIASKNTGRTYTVEIYRPAGYDASKTYPALFMLDGDYAFQPAVALSNYMQRGEIASHLIIGVSNDVPFGDQLAAKRTPDFTPPTKDGVITKDVAAPYYLFLRDELLPEVSKHVRVDPDQKTLWSYSLSGAFALWLNYYDPSLFRNYIIASPNAQYGIGDLAMSGKLFNAPGAAHKLFLSFDAGTELPSPDLEAQVRALLDAGLPGYKTGYSFTHGETHTTSWFVTMPAALRFIYGPG